MTKPLKDLVTSIQETQLKRRKRLLDLDKKFPGHEVDKMERFLSAKTPYKTTKLNKEITSLYEGPNGLKTLLKGKKIIDKDNKIEIINEWHNLKSVMKKAYQNLADGHSISEDDVKNAIDKFKAALARLKVNANFHHDSALAEAIEKLEKTSVNELNKLFVAEVARLEVKLSAQKPSDVKLEAALGLGYYDYTKVPKDIHDVDDEIKEVFGDAFVEWLNQDEITAAGLVQKRELNEAQKLRLLEYRLDKLAQANDAIIEDDSEYRLIIKGNKIKPAVRVGPEFSFNGSCNPKKWGQKWDKFDEGYDKSIKTAMLRGKTHTVSFGWDNPRDFKLNELKRFLKILQDKNNEALKSAKNDDPKGDYAFFKIKPELLSIMTDEGRMSKKDREELSKLINEVNKTAKDVENEERRFLKDKIAPEKTREKIDIDVEVKSLNKQHALIKESEGKLLVSQGEDYKDIQQVLDNPKFKAFTETPPDLPALSLLEKELKSLQERTEKVYEGLNELAAHDYEAAVGGVPDTQPLKDSMDKLQKAFEVEIEDIEKRKNKIKEQLECKFAEAKHPMDEDVKEKVEGLKDVVNKLDGRVLSLHDQNYHEHVKFEVIVKNAGAAGAPQQVPPVPRTGPA